MSNVNYDEGMITFKHQVLEGVARLAWEGKLDEDHKEELITKLIPGPKPTYRCCIYKEREIVRQRIRLACGLNTIANPNSKNEVQVIKSACDGCPISAYSVTDNCRGCIGKACENSCRFGAITITEFRSHIDSTKCKSCGMCADACPYGAIVHLERPCKKVCPVDAITYDEYGLCVIDEEKCINCGQCIHNCPFAAISSKAYITQIIEEIRSGKEVYAMCAPAAEGIFGEGISMASLRTALKKIGFKDMIEVGVGGDMTAAYEALEWTEAYREGKKMTTSCCPAFVNMLRVHFPELYRENMSSVASPMCGVSRYLKKIHPGCVTVFFGPCVAKKSEVADKSIPDNADYAMTLGELRPLLRSLDITLKPEEDENQQASIFGKRFANAGGVANAVLECMKERGDQTEGIQIARCSGGDECRKALMMLKAGRLPEDFIEGMMCNGGCAGGPDKRKNEPMLKKARENLLAKADDRRIIENLRAFPMEEISMHRDGSFEEIDKRVYDTVQTGTDS